MARRNRCSYCGQRGHNRATCPKLKEYIKRNPDSWHAHKAKAKKARAEELAPRRKSSRRCSYCSERGHTIRTCPKKKDMVAKVTATNKKWRANLVKELNKAGLAPGALVERVLRYPDSENQSRYVLSERKRNGTLAMVTGFELDQLNFTMNQSYGGEANVIKVKYPNGRIGRFHLPDAIWKAACPNADPSYIQPYEKIEVAGAVPGWSLAAFGRDWANGSHNAETIVKNGLTQAQTEMVNG